MINFAPLVQFQIKTALRQVALLTSSVPCNLSPTKLCTATWQWPKKVQIPTEKVKLRSTFHNVSRNVSLNFQTLRCVYLCYNS